jgi:putative transposase
MDGRVRWMGNVFIERLWRSLKYECVYLHAFETRLVDAGRAHTVDRLLQRPTPTQRPAGQTPDEAYGADARTRLAA